LIAFRSFALFGFSPVASGYLKIVETVAFSLLFIEPNLVETSFAPSSAIY
jgi:hypothetical protein